MKRPEDFDEWFSETHGGTGKPTWELTDDDTGLDDDYDIDEYVT